MWLQHWILKNAEEELNSVLKHEKEDREAKARTVRSRLIQNLLRLKNFKVRKHRI